MGRLNVLQVLVPLIFLAIWALTSLFNREAQPLPPRTGRPPGPPGPRPGGMGPAGRPLERRPDSFAYDPSSRWSVPTTSGRPAAGGAAGSRPDDEIVILESETRRTPPPLRPQPGSVPRRAQRSRTSSAPAAAKRPEPSSPRALSASMGQEASAPLNRPLDLSRLTKMQAPLAAPVSQEVAAAPFKPPLAAPIPCLTSGEIQAMINSPAKLREAFVVSELLKPPLAMRRDRRGAF